MISEGSAEIDSVFIQMDITSQGVFISAAPWCEVSHITTSLQENIQALDKEDMEMWKVPAVSWLLGLLRTHGKEEEMRRQSQGEGLWVS